MMVMPQLVLVPVQKLELVQGRLRSQLSPERVQVLERLQSQQLPVQVQFPPPVELERRQVQALAPLPISQSAWAQEQVLVQGVQVEQSQIAPVRARVPGQLQLRQLPAQLPSPVKPERRQVRVLAPQLVSPSVWVQAQVLVREQFELSQLSPVRAQVSGRLQSRLLPVQFPPPAKLEL